MRSSESPVGTRISDETATGKGRLMHCQPQSESQTPRQTSAGLQKIDGNFLKRARGGWGFFCREDMPRVFFSWTFFCVRKISLRYRLLFIGLTGKANYMNLLSVGDKVKKILYPVCFFINSQHFPSVILKGAEASRCFWTNGQWVANLLHTFQIKMWTCFIP